MKTEVELISVDSFKIAGRQMTGYVGFLPEGMTLERLEEAQALEEWIFLNDRLVQIQGIEKPQLKSNSFSIAVKDEQYEKVV